MGCLVSTQAPKQTLAERVTAKVRIEHYGVLGSKRVGNGEVPVAEKPDGDTVLIDPCNADFVHRSGPRHAGGAAGAIYDFLNIRTDAAFPQSVKAEIKGEGNCAYHRYGYPHSHHVIHAVGYDFRTYSQRHGELDDEGAVELLGGLYAKILALASKYGRKKLRLVPISAGIFSGPLQARMPELTARALRSAIDRTFGEAASSDAHRATYVDMIEYVEMCIYMESDFRLYREAWARAVDPQAELDRAAARLQAITRGNSCQRIASGHAVGDAKVVDAAQSVRERDADPMAPPRSVASASDPALGTVIGDAH